MTATLDDDDRVYVVCGDAGPHPWPVAVAVAECSQCRATVQYDARNIQIYLNKGAVFLCLSCALHCKDTIAGACIAGKLYDNPAEAVTAVLKDLKKERSSCSN